MGQLKGARIYLSGPIECTPDLGVGWRDNFTALVKFHNLQLKIINPCNKPLAAGVAINSEFNASNNLRKQEKWVELQRVVKKFRKQDLRFTDIADSIVIYVNRDIHLCGSYDELFLAESQRKPLFCIVEGGLPKLPTWLFGVFKLENIFATVEDCVEHLKKLDEQKDKLDDCWLLIDEFLA